MEEGKIYFVQCGQKEADFKAGQKEAVFFLSNDSFSLKVVSMR